MDTQYIFQSNPNEDFSLKWVEVAKPEYAGIQGNHPFVLSGKCMTSAAKIDLYAARSNSFPFYSKNDIWESLLPTWKFKDASGNVIESITAIGTPNDDGTYTYTASAWYVDDLPTKVRQSVYLWATMEVSSYGMPDERGHESYANSKVFDIAETQVGRIYPDLIKFTSDGITPLSASYHWTNHIVPFVATVHSKYYDIIKDDKISVEPGILYDFPGAASAIVPFICTPITSREKEVIDIAPMKKDGKVVRDEDGEIVYSNITNYYYTKSPITSYKDCAYYMASAYLYTSADGDMEKGEAMNIYDYPESSALFKAPVFKLYDDSPDKFYIGGYFIGNLTMPDKSLSAGEVYTATIPVDEARDFYIPPFRMWISDPSDARIYMVPAKNRKTEDDSIDSPWGPVPVEINDAMHFTSSFEQLEAARYPSAYHIENVHGIYFIAKDINYNVWAVDTETARLEKFTAYGEMADVDVDLNKSFWNWVNTSADSVKNFYAKKFYGKDDNQNEFDVENKSLQPSWIVISPEEEVLRNEKPGIYIGYHDSYLVTTHDIHGNVIDADFSNPSAFRGYKYEFDRNSVASHRRSMRETMVQMEEAKGFPGMVDNINKPGAMAIWNNLLYITYSTTSKGIGEQHWEDISQSTESCLRVYDRDIGVDLSKPKYQWDLNLGEGFVDLCIFDGVAYALVSNSDKQSKLVSFSIAGNGESEDMKTIIDYGALERPEHMSISTDGVLWFHNKDREIVGYEIKTNNAYLFTDLYTPDKFWKYQYPENEEYQADPLSGSMAIRKETPASGRYFENEFHRIDAMSIDTDNYLWIVDNFCSTPVMAFDAIEMLDAAKRNLSEGKIDSAYELNAISIDTGVVENGKKKQTVYVHGSYNYNTKQDPYTPQIDWRNKRSQDPRMDVPNLMINGDWTGIRYQLLLNHCYFPTKAELESGRNFVLNNERLQVRKFNESKDIVSDMKKNIRVPLFLQKSESLWDTYAEAMVGGLDSSANQLGRRLYERIANIVPNLHDVEDSTIAGIYAMAEAQDVPVKEYNISPPESMARLLDLLSVKHERLWGERCHCTLNYKETNKSTENKPLYCNNCKHFHRSNLGKKFDLYSRNLKLAKIPYIVKDNMDSKSKFIKISPCEKSVQDAYDVLDKIIHGGWSEMDEFRHFYPVPEEFAESILQIGKPKMTEDQIEAAQILAIHTQFYIPGRWFDYCFWEFRPEECHVQNTGIINWGDKYTTFPESLNSIDKFYMTPSPEGQSQHGLPEGYAEIMMNYILHEGLHFDKSLYKDN